MCVCVCVCVCVVVVVIVVVTVCNLFLTSMISCLFSCNGAMCSHEEIAHERILPSAYIHKKSKH